MKRAGLPPNAFIKNDLLLFLYTISLFMNSYLSFCWSTFPISIVPKISEILKYVGMGIGLYVVIRRRRIQLSSNKLMTISLSMVFVVCVLRTTVQKSSLLSMGFWKTCIDLTILLLLNKEERAIVFRYLKVIFICLSLPGILFFILYLVGIRIPSIEFYSSNELKVFGSNYYIISPLGIINYSKWGTLKYRPCGFFDEPGFMGTIAALLFSAELYKKQKICSKANICLLIIGILSTSFAFYLLVAISLIIHAIRKGFWKFSVILMAILVVFYVFMNLDLSKYHYLNAIQARFVVSGNNFAGDNRTSEEFEIAYSAFLNNGGYPLLFGNGINSRLGSILGGSCSYKTLLYDYGILSTVLLLALLILVYINECKTMWAIILFVPFIASMYQRPYVFIPIYFAILITGTNSYTEKPMDCKDIIGTIKKFSIIKMAAQ